MPRQISTTASSPWSTENYRPLWPTPEITLTVKDELPNSHPWRGFGGCFNELGWHVLLGLAPEKRKAVLESIFGPEGCGFTHCRLPIGASDYALEWYSHNECPDDLSVSQCSVARDNTYLIPYIKAAQAIQTNLEFFASPWSPPTWMKHPRAYNYGTLIKTPAINKAYALYFARFIQAYAECGINIDQVHLQNEPRADQKFPSCLWTGSEMGDFIREYLVPAFREHGLKVETYLGTLNTADFDGFFLPAFLDSQDTIAGIGLQWDGKHMIQRIHQAFPDISITQTENECGDGLQTWAYAEYVFRLIQHYLANGASAYVYWNMILQAGGQSTWGWNQNAMITVDFKSKEPTFTYEFYLIKHFAHFIRRGARLMEISGELSANAVAAKNPDGTVIVVVHNPLPRQLNLNLISTNSFGAVLRPNSFNTFTL
jgi:glucosylceramidase